MLAGRASAQDRPIGQWRSHLPYNSAVSLAFDGTKIYVATQYSFYTEDIAGGEATTYSKVSGMADIGMSKIGYDKTTGTAILAYTNGNIDLFKDENFHNIPDLKIKSVAGTKNINDIYTENGLAYLSTDVGIIVLNLDREEVKETYAFTKNSENIAIRGLADAGGNFYAATASGLYKVAKNNPNIQAFSVWQPLNSTRDFVSIASVNDKVFATKIDSLFVVESDTLHYLYRTDSATRSLVTGVNCVWVMENYDSNFSGYAKRLDMAYNFTDSFSTLGFAAELLDMPDADSTKWIASEFTGLKKRTRKGGAYNTIPPEGPAGISNFDLYVKDKEILVAHGGYDDLNTPSNNGQGFSVYKDGAWKLYTNADYAPFGDTTYDFVKIIKGPDGNIYAGSTQSGLFILKQDGTYEYLKQNSPLNPSVTGNTLYRVSGLAFDENGVLWLTIFGGEPEELLARTTDGTWYKINVPVSTQLANSARGLIIDDYSQKWYIAPKADGVVVFDDNGTPETPLDDRAKRLLAGDGSGGLPDNEVLCLVNDKDGAIWIGTANGIGIVNCPSQVLDGTCEAEKRIVQFDQFAGYLFQNEQVRTIAVDGANRKWIGTNNGVWLISHDGNEIIDRYTTENSPLPSNNIQKIAIDPSTGDVYIGTEQGLISYRGTAVDGGPKNEDELITFPNPIPSGYNGTIAIKGVVENADVRITDISGQLVYKTTALGGQAIWNGKDYTGRRPQSGVYLIFATNKDGSETQTGKLLFME